jgi:hypothetical protein
MDQAALHGMLIKVRNLGFPLLVGNKVESMQGTLAGDDGGTPGSVSPGVGTAKHDKAGHRP